jgi:hypothetical protein
VVAHRLDFLLAVGSVRINLDVTVGSVKPIIFTENQRVNLHSERITLQEAFPHILNEEYQA